MSVAGIELESLFVLPITIFAFLVLLTIIVFFHEYGHFSVARMLGVRVDVFSIGFGKPLLRWIDRKGTEWRIAALPLGGYVKFFGDLNAASQAPPEAEAKPVTTQFPAPGHEEEIAHGMTAEERAVCFHFKPVWARAMIVAAGPIANFVLAVAIFTTMFMTLGRVDSAPIVGAVLENSAAAEAGFQPGDEIVEIDGRSVTKFRHLQDAVLISGGKTLEVTVMRQSAPVALRITPARVESEDRYGNAIEAWQLGIQGDANAYTFEKLGLFEALQQGLKELIRILNVTIRFLGQIILGKEDARQLGGPIKMAQYAGQSVMSGFDESGYREPPGFVTMLRASLVDFIFLAAVVSVSIGFLNLLPVPVLDGGHLLYYAYEASVGKPLGARAQAIGFRVGIVMLASLMIFVTWNDINNLLSSLS
ncbi:MAG: RIP metalloprotease [Pseudomonadota bacterium]